MTDKPTRKSPARKIRGRLKALGRSAQNAATLLKRGRLGAPYCAPYDVVLDEDVFRLRHYNPGPQGSDAEPVPESILLVPPLMVSSDIYDISPELSATMTLMARGLDVWLVDYGAPETEERGMERTMEGHILAVDRAIQEVFDHTGHDVHLVGYSQGGIFAYQAAAYRRCECVASVVTFGAPVDIWRNMPFKMHEQITRKVLGAAGSALEVPLRKLPGLPGSLTSTGFKVFNAHKEVKQIASFFGLLHDREALKKREPKRRFLGGDGFVAWPGPAFREFLDEVVVHNRLTVGGMVFNGKSIGLGDIDCPILIFVGLRDDMARPACVRAITKAAPKAEVYEVRAAAGHFGLVVGTQAITRHWPIVADWAAWHAGVGERPAALDEDPPEADSKPGSRSEALYEVATDALDSVWNKLGDVSLDVGQMVDTLRWQIPRLAKLEGLMMETNASLSAALAEQAESIPEAPFFLWQGHSFTYAQANGRVNKAARVLQTSGVTQGEHVGVLMDNHPDYLTVVTALNRLGAVAVPLDTTLRGQSLEQALTVGEVAHLVVSGAHAERALAVHTKVLCVGGDELPVDADRERVELLDERIDAASRQAIAGLEPGRTSDLALLLFTSGLSGLPKAARITNRRWVASALGAAAACRLTPDDTVYCPLPLYNAVGMLLAVSGALVGGARLALVPRFSVRGFWPDVRRTGATVVVYIGGLCRYLVTAPPGDGERDHSVRLFAGAGMKADVWEKLLDRFGDVQVIDIYGSAEGNVVLANLTGEKIGSVGSPMTADKNVALLQLDENHEAFARDPQGRVIPCGTDQPGVLVGRIGGHGPVSRFEGYTDREATQRRILRDVFSAGDSWFISGDLFRRDEDGDYWHLGRVGDTFRWKGENVSAQLVEEVLDGWPASAGAAVYGVEVPGYDGRAGMAALQLMEGAGFEPEGLFQRVEEHLPDGARPRFVRLVDRFEINEAHEVNKALLKKDGIDLGAIADPVYAYDAPDKTYVRVDAATLPGFLKKARSF